MVAQRTFWLWRGLHVDDFIQNDWLTLCSLTRLIGYKTDRIVNLESCNGDETSSFERIYVQFRMLQRINHVLYDKS
jgi:hypothetical protein